MATKLSSVMVVDQQEVFRLGVKTLLECKEQWKVVADAADGREALNLAATVQPDLVILDHTLPSLNGIDLSRCLRERLPALNIILFTSFITDDLVMDYISAGVRAIVLKTDSFDQLVAAARNVQLGKAYISSSMSEFVAEKLFQPVNLRQQTLTCRERQVVQLVAEGQMNKQVAHILGVSAKTVETHRAAAMNKLNFVSVSQLVRYAVRNNLVSI
ncbi:LuxR family two component transcriptional regulator [Novosphingobium sp. PhB57]|uniref:response regulator n=1 Tax=Novosphingobium sp. PhB57 TaxID=2485107 RepID=UPI0010F3F1BB|nr:response regulator transcription factor [Novosphingobium sp. PhB57]TCU57884.1 LuxR family two component transcriptional regulator [Novosphingobium sp. PhB57]